MNDTAIIIGTYNRAHLLRRSLMHYPDDVDIFVYDDGSEDLTQEVCGYAGIRSYEQVGNKNGWRDSSVYLNTGIKETLQLGYKYIFITHPEIIPGKTTIQSAKELSTDKETWISAKGYYLTDKQQPFLKDDLSNLKELPNFYGQAESAEFRGNPDYIPENIERVNVWHSWIFGGGSREMWQYFGGLTPFEHWGSVDVDLFNRRGIAGMKTITPNKETDIVIHQNHDDLGTPRDMEKCMNSLPRYENKEQALKPELLL